MIDDREVSAQRKERKPDERRSDDEDRRQVEQELVRGARGDVFLDEELGDVGQRLEPAVGEPDLVRPDPGLQ